MDVVYPLICGLEGKVEATLVQLVNFHLVLDIFPLVNCIRFHVPLSAVGCHVYENRDSEWQRCCVHDLKAHWRARESFIGPQKIESVSTWSSWGVADLEDFRPFWDRLDKRCLSRSFLCCCCDTEAEKLVMSLSGRVAFTQSSRSILLPWFASVT